MTTFNPMAPIKAGSWEKGQPRGQTRGQSGQHLSPVATVKKHHRQMATKIHSRICRPEVETKMWQGYALSEALGQDSPCLLPLPVVSAVLGLWLHRASLHPSHYMPSSPLCVYVSVSSFYKDMSHWIQGPPYSSLTSS